MRAQEPTTGNNKGSRKVAKKYQYLKVKLMTKSPQRSRRGNYPSGRRKTSRAVCHRSAEGATNNVTD